MFAKMNEMLGLAIEVQDGTHAAGPPQCWCRKPLPGLGVPPIHRHHLDPARCIYVGDGSRTPATRSDWDFNTVLRDSSSATTRSAGLEACRPRAGRKRLRHASVLHSRAASRLAESRGRAGGASRHKQASRGPRRIRRWAGGRPCGARSEAVRSDQKSAKSQALLCRVHPAMARWTPSGDGIAVTGVPDVTTTHAICRLAE